MNINGKILNCPYWMNKMKNGEVIVAGYLGGKGGPLQIKKEILRNLNSLPDLQINLGSGNYLCKFAKRKRIGIDCSGFAYQVLEKLVKLNYKNCQVKNLKEIFPGGITKTNSDKLTSVDFSIPIDTVGKFQLGDLIRMHGGHHVAVILEFDDSILKYAHSTSSTQIPGVHTGIVKITDLQRGLEFQDWKEETKNGENFGKKYFQQDNGDGVFRLKIFN